MPSFDDHISQTEHNLRILSEINQKIGNSLDWQVTCCFYAALHLVNAHLTKFSLQFRTHDDVKENINPYNKLAIAKLELEPYQSYIALQNLSRRSRYLVNSKDRNLTSNNAASIFEKHQAKAFRHLNILLSYFKIKYDLDLIIPDLSCDLLTKSECKELRMI